MKNISFNELATNVFPVPVTMFLYRDTGALVLPNVKETIQADSNPEAERRERAASGRTAQEIDALLKAARVEAVTEVELRFSKELEASANREAAKIGQALELFQLERKSYFSKVESEVVQLSLAIAAKILHREAQVDPLLVAALVRVAVEKLHDGSSVSVRVSPDQAPRWRECLADPLNGSTIAIVEDSHLRPEDCILETDLGSANFSIDAQLKEVEQGFFDLLAQRPSDK